MPYGLTIFLKFPRNTLRVQAPLPLQPDQGPGVVTPLGRVSFLFDEWDAPPENKPVEHPLLLDSFGVHIDLSSIPSELADRLRSDDYETSLGIVHVDTPEIAAIRAEGFVYGPGGLTEESKAKQDRWHSLHGAQAEVIRKRCDLILKDPVLEPYFGALGTTLREMTVHFLRLLRTGFGQTLVPDLPPVLTANAYWTNPDGSGRPAEPILLDRILSLRSWADAGEDIPAIEPSDWPKISEGLADTCKPPFSEILIASALGQCDPELGNPRLAVIEAVCALEIEVRQLLWMKLESLGLSQSAVDRVMKDTALADLATVWIRIPLTEAGIEIAADVLLDTTNAINDRHEIVHRARQRITLPRARKDVEASARVARAARAAWEKLSATETR